ncbi:MAG TPA: DUF5723 family protein [Bacteroidales bacterium]|nr:DUF5723 family protein [Bacteroidales bacterium]
MKRIIVSLTSILTVALLFCASERILAQQVNSLYFLEKTPFHTKWNPAMAPSRPGIGLGISSLSVNVRSDLALSDLFYPATDGSGIPTSFLSGSGATFLNNLNEVSNFGSSVSSDLLNIGLKLGSKLYITLGSSINADLGIGIPKDLFKLVMLGTTDVGGNLDMSALRLNSMMYAKTGLGISLKLSNSLSIGATANYLLGMANMQMGFDQFTVASNGSSLNVNTKGSLQLTSPDLIYVDYGNGTFPSFKIDQTKMDNFMSNPTSNLPKTGTGLSFDFGLTFKPLNFLTLSAAVIDMGQIKWDPAFINKSKTDGSFTYTGVDFGDKTTSFGDQMAEKVKNLVNFVPDNTAAAFTSKLTTKVNIGAEAGLANNHITLGVLSQTGITETGKYQDYMVSLNLKPGSLFQTALSYSLLHGEMSSFGAAVNLKLLMINLYVAADYIPLKVTPDLFPINNSYFNLQTGVNLMF